MFQVGDLVYLSDSKNRIYIVTDQAVMAGNNKIRVKSHKTGFDAGWFVASRFVLVDDSKENYLVKMKHLYEDIMEKDKAAACHYVTVLREVFGVNPIYKPATIEYVNV